MSANILAVETSTAACSVAAGTADGVFEQHAVVPRQHTALIFTMIDAALAAAGITRSALDVIAFGCGPGAFTGVRIAASVAQGIALARDLPLAPVSSLLALAAGGRRLYAAADVVAALDARRAEIYLAGWHFSDDLDSGTAVVVEQVIAPAHVLLPAAAAWLAVGNGWSAYAGHFPAAVAAIAQAPLLYPHARDVARLGLTMHAAGATVTAEHALPTYLRGAVD